MKPNELTNNLDIRNISFQQAVSPWYSPLIRSVIAERLSASRPKCCCSEKHCDMSELKSLFCLSLAFMLGLISTPDFLLL